jgi:hypothetical protein
MLITATVSCGDRKLIPLKVELGTRAVSKLPFVIAEDQGLYEKYGLDVELRMPAPAFEGGISTNSNSLPERVWRRIRSIGGDHVPWKSDILVDGLTPNMVKRMDQARFPHRIAIAGIDCFARAHIVGNKNIRNVEDLKGKRLGISGRRDTTTGFVALMLARRMGWDPDKDISIKLNGRDIEALSEGLVDAIVASEVRYAVAKKQGFPILLDTREWNIALAGNSVMVEAGWMDDGTNREAARRFLKATIEGLALFHQNRELALHVMSKWNGITDKEIAATIYERGKWLSRSPYPCYEGITNTMELYDSNDMRQHTPNHFYDDSLIRELDESGFIDRIYKKLEDATIVM